MVCYEEGAAGAALRDDRLVRAARTRASARSMLSLRASDPQKLALLLAQNCVKRGVRWLNRHAPSPGWWRNCLDGGRSRVSMGRDNGGILSLAYEYERDLADEYGYVMDVLVMRHLERRHPGISLERLGFSPRSYLIGWQPFPKRYPGVIITSETLDRAWATFLEDPPSMMRINYRHPRRNLGLRIEIARKPFLSGIVDRLRIRRAYSRILPDGRLVRT
ncbi:MAG TPA: hypothetical protein VNU25_01445 [Candidatus Paceibacterota bacterium]|nr:hypothetical protein [Candidatus Paceibacterota bacterium]